MTASADSADRIPLVYSWATDDDVAAVVPLVQSAYRGNASRGGWTTEADLLDGQRINDDMLRDLLAQPGGHVLLARDADDALLVCCELREPDGPGAPAYFGMFAVSPTLQGGGQGRVVLAEAERIARDEFGADAMEMTVIGRRAELIAWYERRGYARTGETRPFPYDDERYGRPKVADLDFVVLRKSLTDPA
ncbi:GNAT family N-acetyltransferase [uncultured Jatrophihabitans sp.]|uniref:GNAT family N-acetyltransferase n=1 Tax=uncultured Jatrophihabitans sp. TaxID=1610747 RepID=UPI0035CAD178